MEKIVDKIVNRLRGKTSSLNFGRMIIVDACRGFLERLPEITVPRILDIGCGHGHDLTNIRNEVASTAEFHGIECCPERIVALHDSGIAVESIDLEKGALPYPDGFFDIVIANQVLEHTKDIFWVTAEVSRVLKPGGLFLVGVPNLASLHNRFLLLLGIQPTSIRILGPHIRGFVRGSFVEFVEYGGYFKVIRVYGANFYPFPPALNKILEKILPGMAVSSFYEINRTGKIGNFIEVLDEYKFETRYFDGKNPSKL